MNQDRPVLRLSGAEWSVDVTAGKAWYVGIGPACEVPLPLSGPAEPWFVVRHAGVWSVRSIDDRTRLTLNRLELATDRGVRIGDQPEQELHVQRGGLGITLRITDPARPVPLDLLVRSSEPGTVPALRAWATTASDHAVAQRGGPGIAADPLAQTISRVVDVPSFLGLMSEHRWPGRLTIFATRARTRAVRDHAVLLTRTLMVGRSSHDLVPAGSEPPSGPGASDSPTVFDLLQNKAGRFPAGQITDRGLLLTVSGTLMEWQRTLERSRELVLSPPPPISGHLHVQVRQVELPELDVLPLLVQAARRLLSGAS